tara:strand:- start:73 stop:477 length:405 start_codon:yes stop_codon:yes gene_type:complete
MIEKPYELLEWGSHPDEGNDDCYTGSDYATLEEARHALKLELDDPRPCTVIAYLELVGPGVHEIHANPSFDGAARRREDERFDRMCRQEAAMLAGMEHGVDAYNDAMGDYVDTDWDSHRGRSRSEEASGMFTAD